VLGLPGMDVGPHPDATVEDAQPADGDVSDVVFGDTAPPDGPLCAATTEACNGADDDCDGRIDESFDRMSDAMICGACGAICPASPGQVAICNSGSCEAP